MYSANQVIDGINKYADNEIMIKLPTSGKWIFGTAFNLAADKVDTIVEYLSNHPISKMLGIVDPEGNIDVDALMDALKKSADKYGKLTITLPLMGEMTFTAADIEMIRQYIE